MQFRVCFAGQDHPGKESLKKREPPRARVRLLGRSVESSPATVTGKYCCWYFFEHSLVKIVK